MIDTIKQALKRAKADLDAGRHAWVPVFADVILNGEKIGHIASDGFLNSTWTFYASAEGRRKGRRNSLDLVLPAWARGAVFANAATYRERFDVGVSS